MATPFTLDCDQCRAVDRRAVDEYGLPGIVLMENAARGATEIVQRRFAPRRVVILAGPGNNGGDGWAMARHLSNGDVEVVVMALAPPRPGTDAEVNAIVTRRMDVPVRTPSEAQGPIRADVIVDALFGTGLTRPLDGDAAALVDRANAAGCPVVAVDVPSGFDADRGTGLGSHVVRAAVTATFVALKPGFRAEGATPYVGEVEVVDIGVPRALVREIAASRQG